MALLTPVYNEVPWNVLGNARTMLEDLQKRGGQHHYAMFILSDTRDPEIAAQEQASIEALRTTLAPGLELYYRRRPQNTRTARSVISPIGSAAGARIGMRCWCWMPTA